MSADLKSYPEFKINQPEATPAKFKTKPTLEQMMERAHTDVKRGLRFGDATWTSADGKQMFNVNAEKSTGGNGKVSKWTFEVNSFGYNRQTFSKMLREAA